MALIEWNGNLSLGIASIDKQHRKLVEMINELNAAMLEGRGKEALSRIINGLADYTKTHFATEETYFQQFGYTEGTGHKAQHDHFANKVLEFRSEFERGRLGLSVKVMQFLSNWLQEHIKGSDKKYAPFLIGRGVK
jgi:hemerythrin